MSVNKKDRKEQLLLRMWRNWNPMHCWLECKIVQPLQKTIWQFLKKLNMKISYDPAILFLNVHARELKVYVGTKIFTQMFAEVLFIIAIKYTQPKCMYE